MKNLLFVINCQIFVFAMQALALPVLAQTAQNKAEQISQLEQCSNERLKLFKERYTERFTSTDDQKQEMISEQEMNMTVVFQEKIEPEKGVSDNSHVSANDSLALVALYYATNGDSWYVNNSWLVGPVNSWYGIIVTAGYVIQISLNQNHLYGMIPPEIGSLSNLQKLSLNNNQISGNIPSQIGDLTVLQLLSLSNNHLIGNIPSQIGNLTNLQSLFLNSNQLSGNIPSEIGNLTILHEISLSNNQFVGNIPTQINNLINLQKLYLNNNNLTGSIPYQIGNLSSLLYLYLNDNQLNSSIPPNICYLTNLQHLYIQNNQITGSIPSEIGNLGNLTELYLNGNQLSGIIPVQIGNLTNLNLLFLYNNYLESPIPETLCTQLNNLDKFSCSLNNFSSEDCQIIRCLINRGNWQFFNHSPQNNEFDFDTDCVEQIDELILTSGWNLISFEIIPKPSSPQSFFAPLITSGNLQMVTGFQNQQGVFFDPVGQPSLNTLTELFPGEGYWVKVINDVTLFVTSEPISSNFKINLKGGWNLIAYWPEVNSYPDSAFASLIEAGVLEMITGYEEGGLLFQPNGLPFLNTLNIIKNGFGYWVKLSSDFNNFSFPSLWQCGKSFIDARDSSTYETILISDHCWMKQNLNIGIQLDKTIEQTDNGIIEKYCYNNIESNCNIYGGLYQWNEMMQYSTTPGSRGICPLGWHLPTNPEWISLTNDLGGSSVAGGKLKSTGTIEGSTGLWYSPNMGADNSSGFTALPAGYYDMLGSFSNMGTTANFWTANQQDGTFSLFRILDNISTNISEGLYFNMMGFSVRCLKDVSSQVSTPSVTTSTISTITSTSAISGGDVTSDGGAPVTARGVCWSTSQNPTISNSLTTNGTGPGAFTSNINGLIPGTTYYVRAYATNSVGTAYGNQLSFVTLAIQCPTSFTDSRDGKVYTTVQIGTQCWMKQNLNIGTRIDGTSEQTNNGTIEKYCYNNLETNCDIFGGLYQWNEMMQYSSIEGVQGICPTGWHVPTNAEWTELTTYVSSQSAWLCNSNNNYIAKALAATTNWNTYTGTCAIGNNLSVNNATGFSWLPGGGRGNDGSFDSQGSYSNIWSTTQYSSGISRGRSLGYSYGYLFGSSRNQSDGFSVRCLKD